MEHTAGAIAEKPIARGTCVHHWLIESSSGPTSRGVCKFCGEERAFENFLQDFLPRDDISLLFKSSNLADVEQDMDGNAVS